MMPNFLIIGAEKSGTTFVHKSLEEHPEIFMPADEISFFENPDYLQSNIKEFEKLFDNVTNEKIVGIKRPNYLTKQECLERIYKHIPKAKFILILKNPIAKAIALYFHNINYGFMPALPLNRGFDLLLNNKLQKKYPRSKEIIEFSFYYKYLSEYLKCFKLENFLILTYDELVKDNLKTIKKVYKFLEIYANFIPKKSIGTRPQKVVYSLPRLKWLRLRNNLIYTYNKDRTRLYENKKISKTSKLICKVINSVDCIILRKIFKDRRFDLNNNLKNRLYSIYKEDINKLEKILKKDLSNWKNF
ncbi:sulfotransferase [Candidatus Parcubacteria bacterium]|nr:sulfotransferase [Candidatus Parcubacteria bacterium]